jgi:hypothetical protein
MARSEDSPTVGQPFQYKKRGEKKENLERLQTTEFSHQ